ncbi:MAG: hypothetical protein ABIH72_04650 [archaeon]
MGELASFSEFREQKRQEFLDELKQRFLSEAYPGSVIHLLLDREIYWDTRTGQLTDKPDFPHNWPLEDFVGWLLPVWDLNIGPRLSPFSVYLSNGNSHTGLGYNIPWEHICDYAVHHGNSPLFG